MPSKLSPFKAFEQSSYKNLKGFHLSPSSNKPQSWDSHFEKKHLLVMDFDPECLSYATQAISFPVPGVTERYTPDAVCIYSGRRVLLKEFKPKAKLTPELDEKYKAIGQYVDDNTNWSFEVVTEHVLHNTQIKNFMKLKIHFRWAKEEVLRFLLKNTELLGVVTNIGAIQHAAISQQEKFYLWAGVAYQFGMVDFNSPITARTPINWSVV
ncbi:hypothetical protein KO525_06435 [Psychrosphaera sp. B3R10]|uniref:hypothetical protein n=1 Tax=unclassified Psychrosphaera TaxID=2641570 RepID=UPI001C09B3D4|nr:MULTISPECIES: hypothetical protein [unclassified Psychrosphaera]MBU2882333.1 hypothetical protein [Psychrosphaera sp. I2R16]MBU2989014.1 hypothetical protein [Psychrosphaera sp. B3R10]